MKKIENNIKTNKIKWNIKVCELLKINKPTFFLICNLRWVIIIIAQGQGHPRMENSNCDSKILMNKYYFYTV